MKTLKEMKMEALEHWNKIACGSRTEAPNDENCPYCSYIGDCYKCPICILTGSIQCRNTPFYKVYNKWLNHSWRVRPWQAKIADEIETMIELIESLPEEE